MASRPTITRGYCDACGRSDVVLLASRPIEALARGRYGKLRPSVHRRTPYLCRTCLIAFRIPSAESVIEDEASAAALAAPEVFPEGWT